MKVGTRLRHPLLQLLLRFLLLQQPAVVVSYPQTVDWKNQCGGKQPETVCVVHRSCTAGSADTYRRVESDDEVAESCNRYLILQVKSKSEIEVTFRDDKISKLSGVTFVKKNGGFAVWSCINNKLESTQFDITSIDSQFEKLYCKFGAAVKNEENIADKLGLQWNMQYKEGNTKTIEVELRTISDLLVPCMWSAPLFDDTYGDKPDQEQYDKIDLSDPTKGICPAGFLAWYRDDKHSEWTRISHYFCEQSVIRYIDVKNDPKSIQPANINAQSKCARKKCGICGNPFGPVSSTRMANYTPTDIGSDVETCSTLKCPNDMKYMMLTTEEVTNEQKKVTVETIHFNSEISCSASSLTTKQLWERHSENGKKEDFPNKGKIINATCFDTVKCSELDKMKVTVKCPRTHSIADMQESDGWFCVKNTTLDDSGSSLCDPKDKTYYKNDNEKGTVPQSAESIKCDGKTARWSLDGRPITTDITVFCLRQKTKDGNEAEPKTGGITGGMLIGVLLGGALVAAIATGVTIFLCRRHIKNKRDKQDLKSVSVTGKSKKGKNSKKSKKDKKKDKKWSFSKSEQTSVPPSEPPIPQSIPEPTPPPVPTTPAEPAAPVDPAAAAAAAAAAPTSQVGPDTGKPDKPAELIDIVPSATKNNVSEKASEKAGASSKKAGRQEGKKKGEATVANTVTGTSFDKPNVGPEPSGGAGESTKKDDKAKAKKEQDESMVSDTGRQAKNGSKKKVDKKDRKVDKKGRGLTDDDEYDIGEGAKQVKHDDKNKKGYLPKHTRHVNVTVDTEDLDPAPLKGVDLGPRKKKT